MDGSVARPRPFLALGIRLATALVLATMGMLVKLASEHGVQLVEMIFWRQALTFALIGGGLVIAGKLATVRTQRFGSHAVRAVLGGLGMLFTYGAVILLPLAEATTLSFSAPLFAVLLAMIVFKERIGIYRWAAVIVGFAGVLVLTQPGSSADISMTGLIVALIAAFMVSLISFQIQDLNKTETPWSIVFWFTGMTAPIAAIGLPFVFVAHDGETWLILLAMALCGALAQILLTSSLRFGSAGVVLLMDYTALLWATYYGWSVFDRAPSASLWLGAPLIILAGLLIAWRERRLAVAKARQANPMEPVGTAGVAPVTTTKLGAKHDP